MRLDQLLAPRLRAVLAPAALFLLLALGLFAPAVVGGKVLSANDILLSSPPFPGWESAEPANPLLQDPAYVFQPDQLQVRRALRSAELPVWTSGLSAGRPLLAAQQSAPLFPLNWIGDVLPYWESLVWIAALKLMLAGLGLFLLCRQLGLGTLPALVGGLSYALATYLVVWLSHPHVNAYIMLPWLFLLIERLCRSGGIPNAVGLSTVVGLAFLGGHPQSAAIVTVAAVAWTLYRLASLALGRATVLSRAALVAGAAVLGVALAAVMLVPFAEALAQSRDPSRGGPPLAAKAGLSLFFPEYWGRADRAVPLTAAPVLGPGASNFAEQTLYIGTLPLVLALSGLFARRPRGSHLFFLALAAGALVVALDSGPITDFARDLPVLSSAQLNRTLVVASFAGSVLAAFGLDRLLRGSQAERRRMLAAAGIAVLLPALVVLLARPSSLEVTGDALRRLLGRSTPLTGEVIALASVLRWLILGSVAIVLVAALALRPRRATILVAAAIVVVAGDLIAMDWGYQPTIDKASASPPEPQAVKVMRALADGGARVAGDGGLGPNTAPTWGLADARGHELPVVERHERLWAVLGGGFFSPQRTRVIPNGPGALRVLDMFGVRAYIAGARTLPQLPVVYEGPDGVVMRNPTALPRAFVAYGWRRSSSLDQSLLLTAAADTSQSRDQPVIETLDAAPSQPPPRATSAEIVEDTNTSVTVRVDARAPGHLILLDTYYPGWGAEVDGREAEIRPANAGFRAVKLSPGRHDVRFRYRPASVYAGGAITLMALTALLALLLVSRLRSRRVTAPTSG